MSTYYLFDMHSNPITASRVRGQIHDPSGSQVIERNGVFVVTVPTGVQVDGPVTSLNSLLTDKYAGLLNSYPGFTRITFDDLLDSTTINNANCTSVSLGERNEIAVNATGGILESTAIALTPGNPTEAIVVWEAFDGSFINTTLGTRITKGWQQVDPDTAFTCDVSFDNGANFNTVTNGALFAIPPAEQGTTFIIRLTKAGSAATNVGSWAVVY